MPEGFLIQAEFKEDCMSLKIRRALVSMLLAASLVIAALPAASLAQGASAVTVDAVAVHDGQLTITGSNFGSAPTVTLGGAALAVASAADSEIVAQLPALESGIYELVVSRGDPEGTVHTNVTIQ